MIKKKNFVEFNPVQDREERDLSLNRHTRVNSFCQLPFFSFSSLLISFLRNGSNTRYDWFREKGSETPFILQSVSRLKGMCVHRICESRSSSSSICRISCISQRHTCVFNVSWWWNQRKRRAFQFDFRRENLFFFREEGCMTLKKKDTKSSDKRWSRDTTRIH